MLRGAPIEAHRVHRNRFDKKFHLVGRTSGAIKKARAERTARAFRGSFFPTCRNVS
jgi:hypothetical protein